jgi:hypothetical protein
VKKAKPTYEEILADLQFMLEQSFIIEHKQDYAKIRELCRKYGVSL